MHAGLYQIGNKASLKLKLTISWKQLISYLSDEWTESMDRKVCSKNENRVLVFCNKNS